MDNFWEISPHREGLVNDIHFSKLGELSESRSVQNKDDEYSL